jgi:hypothetical protein
MGVEKVVNDRNWTWTVAIDFLFLFYLDRHLEKKMFPYPLGTAYLIGDVLTNRQRGLTWHERKAETT